MFYFLVFKVVYTRMFSILVRDLAKLSPIPMNQQQFPFGNAQWNATCNCSGIIQVEVPPSFLDLPSPQVKSQAQPTADMTRHIQCIAETLNHSLPSESAPILHSKDCTLEQKLYNLMFLKVTAYFPKPAKANKKILKTNTSVLKTEDITPYLW